MVSDKKKVLIHTIVQFWDNLVLDLEEICLYFMIITAQKQK